MSGSTTFSPEHFVHTEPISAGHKVVPGLCTDLMSGCGLETIPRTIVNAINEVFCFLHYTISTGQQ